MSNSGYEWQKNGDGGSGVSAPVSSQLHIVKNFLILKKNLGTLL